MEYRYVQTHFWITLGLCQSQCHCLIPASLSFFDNCHCPPPQSPLHCRILNNGQPIFAFQLSRLSWHCFAGAFADNVPLKSCDTPFYPKTHPYIQFRSTDFVSPVFFVCFKVPCAEHRNSFSLLASL